MIGAEDIRHAAEVLLALAQLSDRYPAAAELGRQLGIAAMCAELDNELDERHSLVFRAMAATRGVDA